MTQSVDPDRLARLAADREVFGAKVAILCGGRLVAYLRDDFAHIPDPARWDLPGGEREPGETALDCALREVEEEFGIRLPVACIEFADVVFKGRPPRRDSVLFIAHVPQAQIDAIVFGGEGQCWEMMRVANFIAHPDAVVALQRAVAAWSAAGCPGA